MKKGSGIGGHLRRIGQFLAITVGAATLFTSCGDGGPSGGSDAGVGIGRTQEDSLQPNGPPKPWS